MNVENNQENLQTVEGTVISNVGVSDNDIDNNWSWDSSLSSGDSGQAVDFDISGNGNTDAVTESDNTVSGSNSYIGTSTDINYSAQLVEVSQGITALNGTVTLLFFFLLMTWAEKKINTVVRRFSKER